MYMGTAYVFENKMVLYLYKLESPSPHRLKPQSCRNLPSIWERTFWPCMVCNGAFTHGCFVLNLVEVFPVGI